MYDALKAMGMNNFSGYWCSSGLVADGSVGARGSVGRFCDGILVLLNDAWLEARPPDGGGQAGQKVNDKDRDAQRKKKDRKSGVEIIKGSNSGSDN